MNVRSFFIAFGPLNVLVACSEDMPEALRSRNFILKDRLRRPVTHPTSTDQILMWEERTLENIKHTHFFRPTQAVSFADAEVMNPVICALEKKSSKSQLWSEKYYSFSKE